MTVKEQKSGSNPQSAAPYERLERVERRRPEPVEEGNDVGFFRLVALAVARYLAIGVNGKNWQYDCPHGTIAVTVEF